MQNDRRGFLKFGASMLAGCAGLVTGLRMGKDFNLNAQGVPRPAQHMNPNDPAPKALGYVEDATKADASKFPQLKTAEGKNQNCKGCMLFTNPQAGWGQCTIFPMGLVPEGGWCGAWAKKA